jgi:hypothetical protein
MFILNDKPLREKTVEVHAPESCHAISIHDQALEVPIKKQVIISQHMYNFKHN